MNHVHLHSDYLHAFREAGLNVVQCLEPVWSDMEIATFGFADQMPDPLEAAVEGLPIVVVWELEKSDWLVSDGRTEWKAEDSNRYRKSESARTQPPFRH